MKEREKRSQNACASTTFTRLTPVLVVSLTFVKNAFSFALRRRRNKNAIASRNIKTEIKESSEGSGEREKKRAKGKKSQQNLSENRNN